MARRRRSRTKPSADVQSTGRRLDGIDPLPAKRAGINTQQSGKEPEQAAKEVEAPCAPSLEPEAERARQASPATPSQKRGAPCEVADDSGRQFKRARLTRKNLDLLSQMGRKQGTTKASVAVPPGSAVESSTTKTTSTTISGFAIQARKNGILEPRYSKPPTNLEDIHRNHTRCRETASPPAARFKNYVDRVGGAVNEATMVFEVGGKLLKEYDDERYKRAFNQAFTGFPKDVGFNNGLSAPQPDFVEGLEMEDFRPFPVDEHVPGAILYKDSPGSLTLPHLAGEWKGPGRDMSVATLQSGYAGAALVYARNQALSLLGTPDAPGHAAVRTFTTDGTNINFFAHYAAPCEDGTVEYHQYQYASANVKDTHRGHKDGRRGLRNEQQHAREQSYALRDRLKAHWRRRRSGLRSGGGGEPAGEPAVVRSAYMAGDEVEGAQAGEPAVARSADMADDEAEGAWAEEPAVARSADIADDEDGHGGGEMQPPHQPTPPASKTKRRPSRGVASSSRSASSRAPPPANEGVAAGGSRAQKRKASLAQARGTRQRRREGPGASGRIVSG